MTNADKMFEELGYIKHENNFGIYYHDKEDKWGEYTAIVFDKEDKTLHFEIYITMQELKAINQKCKELGWLDD